ncbi:MAG TPA: alpha-hydroxy acid oxidase [Burkholderiales bacterium]|nr:alpha-hydroxy acid oxidase [Burkholderiales bacterium]
MAAKRRAQASGARSIRDIPDLENAGSIGREAKDFLTTHEIIQMAQRRLTPQVWNYLSGASESETTMRRNRMALDSLALRQRVCVDVSRIDTSASLLGQKLAIPVFMAPMGLLELFDAGGAVATAKAAVGRGIVSMVSTPCLPQLEDAARAVDRPLLFQLYVRSGRDWIEKTLKRAKAAGCCGIAVTLDRAVLSRRERDLIHRWTARRVGDPAALNLRVDRTVDDPTHQASITWKDLAWMKKVTGLPLIAKGIMSGEDADLAVKHGVDVVYVTNHGGRQLDHGQGTIEVLQEVVGAVKGRAEVVVDGGFVRGSDVIKAIALGADAVGIGRAQGWALAAGGEAALTRYLQILETEIVSTLGLMGVQRLADLGPDSLRKAAPTIPPSALSQFPHLEPVYRF